MFIDVIQHPLKTEGDPHTMARKPNYSFERNNRAKIKAEKREAKRQAKLAARSQKAAAEQPAEDAPPHSAGQVAPSPE